jgi:hypothetical protein
MTENTPDPDRIPAMIFGVIISIGLPLVLIYLTFAPHGAIDSMCSGGNGMPTEFITGDVPILSLQDTQSISGSFFLGSGSVNQLPVYTFYINDNQNGGYKIQRLSEDDTRIHMDATNETGARWIMKRKLMKSGLACRFVEWNELHVPPETIIREFKLDGV